MGEGWVASDSTPNEFEDGPGGMSLVSVAVAVTDMESYEEAYFETIDEVLGERNLNPHPVAKGSQFNRAMPDWLRKKARAELVEELLDIQHMETIQITETYLQPRWIELYTQDESEDNQKMSAEKFKRRFLSQYYNLVSIWKYLTYGDSRVTETRYNVITDDFSGKRTPIWEEVGELADQLKVIPYGDRTYPLLSTSDLLLTYLKEEVYPLFAQEIYKHLRELTGEDGDEEGVYINSHSVPDPESQTPDEVGEIVQKVSPHRDDDINLTPHYPSPTVHINRQGFDKNKLLSLDLFAHACKYAQENRGCVKLFQEENDREYFREGDMLINMNSGGEHLEEYEKLNSAKGVNVLSSAEAMGFFDEEL